MLELSCGVVTLMFGVDVSGWVGRVILVISTSVCRVVLRAYPVSCEVFDCFKFVASSLNEEIVVVLSKLIIGPNRCITIMTQCESLAKSPIFNLTSITCDASSLRHRGICRGTSCLWPSFDLFTF